MTITGYSEHDRVSAIRYSKPILSSENMLTYEPEGLWTPTIDVDNIAYQSMFKPFNLNQYLYPRPPIDMGLFKEQDGREKVPNVLRMPIRFPKSIYKIPAELAPLLPLIHRVSEYEKFINPQHDECFCHITFDHSVVKADEYHRFPGFHGDGIQGTKLTPKVNVEHSYVLVNDPGTEFCLQPFFLKHLDEAKHNFFLEFDKQAKDVNIFSSISNHLYLIDPYMVHRSPKIKENQERTFIRITYAFTELQHPKNTLNPFFSGQEYEKRMDIRLNLTENEFPIPLYLYGLGNKQ